MNGSDKQVQWATDIQTKALAEAARYFDGKLAVAEQSGQGDVFRALASRTMELLEINDDPKFWIETVSRGSLKVWLTPLYNKAVAEYQAAQQQQKGA